MLLISVIVLILFTLCQLKGRNSRLEEYNSQLNEKMVTVERDADTQIQKHKERREAAERQTTTMSTKFSAFRAEKEMLTDALTNERDALRSTVRDLHKQIHKLVSGYR